MVEALLSYRRLGKRIFDVIIALSAMIILSPLWLALAILVRLQMGAPVLYRQPRPGLGGRQFTIYKFRTMTNACDPQGNLLPDEQRLTLFGTFLRNSSLDELPELINVIRGDMSLVGPRPLLTSYLDRYTPEQMRRHELRPGITGWAQINGRNTLPWEEKFARDLWYVDNVSFWIDVRILLVTAWKVLRREGINQDDHITAEEFMGNQ